MPKNVLSDISRADMEAAARARGYDNYDQMIRFMRQRIPPPRAPRPAPTGRPVGGNFLQQLWNDPWNALRSAFAWHPANTLTIASDTLRDATDR